MKSILFAILLLAVPAYCQSIISPEVMSDGRVTFRLKAPEAKEVLIRCEGFKNSAMTKDSAGVWSLTTEPMQPDFYTYFFRVDGVRVLDPVNAGFKYNLLNSDSVLHVPGPKTLPWEINDVPRGQLHRHYYRSAIAEDERDFVVYTPPGYDPASRKRYPVLYLLHGYSDDATGWSTAGTANVILDNLIARGEAKPMIIVMPLGYGTTEILKPGGSMKENPLLWLSNQEKFRGELFNEVMPQVEKAYRTKTNREARAIAGLSMGGSQSLTLGLNNLDRFGAIGSFSAGGSKTNNYETTFPKLDAREASRLSVFWIACGKEDKLLEPNQRFVDWLHSKGITPTWNITSGSHSYRVWRRNLAAFAPLLFRTEK